MDFAHRPEHLPKSVIDVPTSYQAFFVPKDRMRTSSLGTLDCLPLELQHDCLSKLDLRSLARLSRVSCHGEAVVVSLRQLQVLTEHADNIFATLTRTKVIHRHSVARLHAALTSENCISCGQYGPYLRLLTAERCCYLCLLLNPSLQLISIPKAKECFALTNRQTAKLVTMWSIPGRYADPRGGVGPGALRRRSLRLVGVDAAKALALKAHKSLIALDKKHPLVHENYSTDQHFEALCRYRQAPLGPLALDSPSLRPLPCGPGEHFGGLGVVPFPSFSGGHIEHGLWCRQCDVAVVDMMCNGLRPEALAQLAPPGCDGLKRVFLLKYRAWSASGLLEHERQCHCPPDLA